MFKDFFKNYIYPISTLAGSIIGVGFLSLPYITLKVGIWPMLFYFIAITAIILLLHVIFGKISLQTPDYKRFPGFAQFYLGTWAKIITLVSLILGSFGVMLVYLIVGGQFLATLATPIFGGTAVNYVFVYFLAGSFLIYLGVKMISRVELGILLLLLGSFLLIFITEFSNIHLGNIFSLPAGASDWKTLFLPYGIIMFSLWGTGLIPEIEEMLQHKKQLLTKVIVISTLIPAIIYALFIFLVLGISGSHTSESALVGLKAFLGARIFLVAIFIGFITTFTAFITQGLFLQKTLMYDMGIKKFPAWLFVCATPLVFFLLGFNSFIPLMSFIGGVFLGINGILILWMYQKIGGKKIVIYPLTVVFILGILYQIVYLVK